MSKYLRFAVSVLSLTACALLIALWVRSYWWMDEVSYVHSPTKVVVVVSVIGHNSFRIAPWQFTGAPRSMIQSYWKPQLQNDTNAFLDFNFQATSNRIVARVPSWFPIVLFALLAAAPWMRWRFSLRTLLIATTLFAVAMGSVVSALRN